MDMDWETGSGTMIVSMIKYSYKVIEEFPEVTIMNQSKVFTPSLNTGSRWE